MRPDLHLYAPNDPNDPSMASDDPTELEVLIAELLDCSRTLRHADVSLYLTALGNAMREAQRLRPLLRHQAVKVGELNDAVAAFKETFEELKADKPTATPAEYLELHSELLQNAVASMTRERLEIESPEQGW